MICLRNISVDTLHKGDTEDDDDDDDDDDDNNNNNNNNKQKLFQACSFFRGVGSVHRFLGLFACLLSNSMYRYTNLEMLRSLAITAHNNFITIVSNYFPSHLSSP